ncbi:MAG: RNA methyltransferase, partial [Bacteroidales bacterium]|nr:RNA methyltransferase [Bacteroidales bacterium]
MTQELQEGFKEEMRGLLGEEESVALIEALDEAPEVSIRLNPQKTFPLPPDFPVESRVAWCPEGYYLKSRP